MARVYVSRVSGASEIEKLIIDRLSENHEIVDLNLELGNEWKSSFRDLVRQADVFVLLITERYIHSKRGENELNTIISYSKNSNKALIPIIIGPIDPPQVLEDRLYIQLDPREAGDIDRVINTINLSISKEIGESLAKEDRRIEQIQKIETKAASYVEEALEELQAREASLKKAASFWYWLGYLAIAIGVIASALFAIKGQSSFQAGSTAWDFVAFIAIKSVVLIGLLLALSKYAFTLAKSYMDESLKNADRIHAISFGKFYLQAYGDNTEANDIKEVFQHWNTGGNNSFSGIDPNVIDPKILEAVVAIAQATSKNKK